MEIFLVDHLARVFDLLRIELKEDAAKDLFLQHSGVSVILPYLKITHRVCLDDGLPYCFAFGSDACLLCYRDSLLVLWMFSYSYVWNQVILALV
jgi:hypothetical protein